MTGQIGGDDPMPHIDAKFLAKVQPPPAGRKIHWDDKLKGFGALLMASGHRSFVFQYRVSGKLRRMTIEASDVDTARTQAEVLKGKIATGRLLNQPADPLAERRRLVAVANGEGSFEAIAVAWFENAGKSTRSGEKRFQAMKRCAFPVIGSMQIGDIRRSHLVKLADKITAENGPGQCFYVMACVRPVMSWYEARDEDFRTPFNSVVSKIMGKPKKRQRTLSDDELRAIWHAARADTGPYGPLLQFILLTAARGSSEAIDARHSEIVDDCWRIPAARYKSKIEHIVPLSPAAVSVLSRLPRIGHGDFIFTTGGNTGIGGRSRRKRLFDKMVIANLQKIAMDRGDHALLTYVRRVEDLIKKADTATNEDDRRRLGKELTAIWWTQHDLRRTARTLMGRARIPSDIAERCLGHVKVGTRETYDCWEYLPEKREAFEKLFALVDEIVSSGPDLSEAGLFWS